MMKLSPIAKHMFLTIVVLASVFIVAGVVYYHSISALPFALGVILTAGLNVYRVKMLDDAVNKVVSRESDNPSRFLQIQYFIRFILTGAVLVIAALTPVIDLWGAAIGILTWPMAAFALKLYIKES